jgi:hypothetical protein
MDEVKFREHDKLGQNPLFLSRPEDNSYHWENRLEGIWEVFNDRGNSWGSGTIPPLGPRNEYEEKA